MIITKLYKPHYVAAVRTFQRIITKRQKDILAPFGKAAHDFMFGFIDVMKHTKDNTANRLEKAVKERTILKKEMAKSFINGKDAMAVCTVYQLK